jgi:tRNA(fMet)-specific endonuclease VapC
MLKYMLDTNIVIYTMKNKPPQVRTLFKKHDGQMCISSVTLGELIFGAERSAIPEKNLSAIESFIARIEVEFFDIKGATHFGQIKAELTQRGTPIGPYDTMIAGHARSLGMILVTNNLKEFERIEGLRLENWAT